MAQEKVHLETGNVAADNVENLQSEGGSEKRRRLNTDRVPTSSCDYVNRLALRAVKRLLLAPPLVREVRKGTGVGSQNQERITPNIKTNEP